MSAHEAVRFAVRLRRATRPASRPSVRGPAAGAPGSGAETTLTARELEIAALIARGLSNRGIADELVISPATAARHVANIFGKLGFTSRAQVAAWAVQRESGRAAGVAACARLHTYPPSGVHIRRDRGNAHPDGQFGHVKLHRAA